MPAKKKTVAFEQALSELETLVETLEKGELSLEEARNKALYATRQLAKRQITWLRSETGVFLADPLEAGAIDVISTFLAQSL